MAESTASVPRPRSYYTEPEHLDVGGIDVAYRRKGQGEPTLFLHGAGFTRMWLPFYEELSRRVDLIAPEHPGYGETAMPDWLSGFDDYVLHYDELLDALGLDRVHLVGYSLGGWTAAELAVFFPRRLRSLTLITPAGLRIPDKPIKNLIAMTPEELWSTVFNDPTNLPSVLPDYEDLEEIVHQYGEGTTLARLAWNPNYDLKLERRLRRVTCPALVMRAEEDRLLPDEIAERYAELLPAARLHTIPRTGHALPVEQPEQAAAVIADFIEEAR